MEMMETTSKFAKPCKVCVVLDRLLWTAVDSIRRIRGVPISICVLVRRFHSFIPINPLAAQPDCNPVPLSLDSLDAAVHLSSTVWRSMLAQWCTSAVAGCFLLFLALAQGRPKLWSGCRHVLQNYSVK